MCSYCFLVYIESSFALRGSVKKNIVSNLLCDNEMCVSGVFYVCACACECVSVAMSW